MSAAAHDPTRKWSLDELQAVRAAQIKALQQHVRTTKRRWHALSADVPEAVETLARTAYQDASWKYLDALESYFAMTEEHRRKKHHGSTNRSEAHGSQHAGEREV